MTGKQTDPLGVLETTRRVVNQAKLVCIDREAAARVVKLLATQAAAPPDWNRDLHWEGTPEQTANYLLLLDALNFCFWGKPRWRITYRGTRYDGYWALAAALKRAIEGGLPLYDAGYLADLDAARLQRVFQGEHTIPLFGARLANAREVGRVLIECYGGEFVAAIELASGSATRLVEIVVSSFPSFRDTVEYKGSEVRFYKRAQILAGDLSGAFGGTGLGNFTDLNQITAFADYKVPQVLHALGVLTYAPALGSLLDRQQEIPAGSPEEVEIRAATIWGVEEIRRQLAGLGQNWDAYRIDWALWELGQHLPPGVRPYHRTRTIAY
jgi:hypothetical protein